MNPLRARFRERKNSERNGKEPRENQHGKIFSKMNKKSAAEKASSNHWRFGEIIKMF
jgi:hypothetical protein